jgi:hypothetical protein
VGSASDEDDTPGNETPDGETPLNDAATIFLPLVANEPPFAGAATTADETAVSPQDAGPHSTCR